MRKEMNYKKAIEFCEEAIKMAKKGNIIPTLQECERDFNDIIALLKTQQERITQFSEEGDMYQEKLDQIDLWAMEIQDIVGHLNVQITTVNVEKYANIEERVKKIRANI